MSTAITYPTTLPGPAAMTVQGAERRALASMEAPTPGSARALQRDRQATATLRFSLDARQWAAWQVWWRLALTEGAAWFSAPTWAVPWGTGAVVQFTSPLQVTHTGAGLRQVEVQAQLRGAGQAPVQVTPPYPISVAAIESSDLESDGTAILAAPAMVYAINDQLTMTDQLGTGLAPFGRGLQVGLAFLPDRAGVLSASVQFRGAADTSASLGRLGFVVNAENNTAAAALLAAGRGTRISSVTGASSHGVQHLLSSDEPIVNVHIGQLSMSGTYVVADSGPCRAADIEFARLSYTADTDIRHLLITEGPPTNFAGVPGTGSARQVFVRGANAEGGADL